MACKSREDLKVRTSNYYYGAICGRMENLTGNQEKIHPRRTPNDHSGIGGRLYNSKHQVVGLYERAFHGLTHEEIRTEQDSRVVTSRVPPPSLSLRKEGAGGGFSPDAAWALTTRHLEE